MPPEVPAEQTHFLPATRTDPAVLAAEVASAIASPLVNALLEASMTAAAVLDGNRQVVAFNASFLVATGLENPDRLLGLRPGEAVGCAFIDGVPTGCGTGEACPSCGAALSIVAAMSSGHAEERRCALAILRDGARIEREFRARSTPIRIEGRPFVLLTLQDVSLDTHRSLVDRSFMHDLSNLALGLQGAAEDLTPTGDGAAEDVRLLSEQLAQQVRLQKLLADGERAALGRPSRRPLEVSDAVALLRRAAERHAATAGRTVEWPRVSIGLTVPADPALLQHVLFHMLLNALEATPPGGRVRVEVVPDPERVRVRVWNAAAIPEAVVPRIFQRYFSTKAEPGHGHGTWSMRLIGELLLGGKVSFETSAEAGTTFQIALPRCRER